MLKLNSAKHDFANEQVTLTITNGTQTWDYETDFEGLQKFLIDVAKVRLMASVQGDKLANITEHMAQTIQKQDKAVRSILIEDAEKPA